MQKIQELEEKLKVLMLPKDPNDERDVMVIRYCPSVALLTMPTSSRSEQEQEEMR